MPINDKVNTNYYIGQARKEKKKKVKNVRIQYKYQQYTYYNNVY